MSLVLQKLCPFILPGLIYGIGCLGLGFIFRYLKFPDFTILGSIMTGGIVCIYVSNISNPVFGIILGSLVGGILGLITGCLISGLKVNKVLASIVTLTASFSIGYSLTEGGIISLDSLPPEKSIIGSVFRLKDALLVSGISLIICIFLVILMRTKFGLYLIGMTASNDFLKYRHRAKNSIIISTLFIGNSLVGLSGAIFALRDKSANVICHPDFLAIILAAIFGGNGLTRWISYKLHTKRVVIEKNRDEKNGPSKFIDLFSNIYVYEREEPKKIFALFCSYLIGTFLIQLIHGAISTNTFFKVPFNISFLIIAAVIIISIWWTGIEDTA